MRSNGRRVTSRGWTAPARVLTRATAAPRRALVESIPGAAARGRGIPKAKPEDRSLPARLAAAPRTLVVGVPRASAAVGYDQYVHRKVRDPLDKAIAWGVMILAIAMAIGYQLLLRTDALRSFARRR